MRQILMDSPRRPPNPDSRAVLEVRNLCVDFETIEGSIRAVDNLSFKVHRRRTLGVVGESGCGKSVTTRAIMRIVDEQICKTSGSILLHRAEGTVDLAELKCNGSEMRKVRGREIALVFQEPFASFSPVHTIGNQIIEAVRLHFPTSKRNAREKSITQLKSVGTPHPEHIMNQYSWQLSGGLCQRAMIAMALVCGPKLLIADEPTTALDVTTQAQVLSLLKDLQVERGMALMLITHDLGVIAQVADDVIIMYLGNIVERGSVESIFQNPMHPYTQLLLESLPRINKKRSGSLKTLRGMVPHARNRPTGCPFHTRCPSAMPGVCDRLPPADTVIGDSHTVSCHLYSDSDVESAGADSSESRSG